MKKIFLLILLSLMVMGSLCAVQEDGDKTPIDESGAANLKLQSGVPAGSGVVVPEGVKLIGNLAIRYNYEDSGWMYVSSEEVIINNLGVKAGQIALDALYYGNEPEVYSCSVTFNTGNGWTRVGDSSVSLRISLGTVNKGATDTMKISTQDDGFSLSVPVTAPINGEKVAEVVAYWDEDPNLPSGEYTADITISVNVT